MKDRIHSAQIVLPCENLQKSLEFFIEKLGFRLEMIFPADAPSTAVISGCGLNLRLEESNQTQPLKINLVGDFASQTEREIFSPDGVCISLTNGKTRIEIPAGTNEFVLTEFENGNSWHKGRAGMLYRDLIPNRLGGRFIASHIRIPTGGAIADYVHFHKIRFQMIYCLSGWSRLVYEDQGEPFLMKAGDCVLQPPEIRHRVLECSDGFEVVEIGCPAVHETFADYEMNLPNEKHAPEKIFGGQRFARHVAENFAWTNSEIENLETRDTGIFEATKGLADVRILRAKSDVNFSVKHSGEFLFFFITKGGLRLRDGDKTYRLNKFGSFVLPSGAEYFFEAGKGFETVRVSLPG